MLLIVFFTLPNVRLGNRWKSSAAEEVRKDVPILPGHGSPYEPHTRDLQAQIHAWLALEGRGYLVLASFQSAYISAWGMKSQTLV
jgi:hypothetical protein